MTALARRIRNSKPVLDAYWRAMRDRPSGSLTQDELKLEHDVWSYPTEAVYAWWRDRAAENEGHVYECRSLLADDDNWTMNAGCRKTGSKIKNVSTGRNSNAKTLDGYPFSTGNKYKGGEPARAELSGFRSDPRFHSFEHTERMKRKATHERENK